jgi:hypothetical protein
MIALASETELVVFMFLFPANYPYGNPWCQVFIGRFVFEQFEKLRGDNAWIKGTACEAAPCFFPWPAKIR